MEAMIQVSNVPTTNQFGVCFCSAYLFSSKRLTPARCRRSVISRFAWKFGSSMNSWVELIPRRPLRIRMDWHCKSINLPVSLRTGGDTWHSLFPGVLRPRHWAVPRCLPSSELSISSQSRDAMVVNGTSWRRRLVFFTVEEARVLGGTSLTGFAKKPSGFIVSPSSCTWISFITPRWTSPSFLRVNFC